MIILIGVNKMELNWKSLTQENSIFAFHLQKLHLVFWAMVMGICGNANVEWYDCMNGEKTDQDYHSAIWIPVKKSEKLED